MDESVAERDEVAVANWSPRGDDDRLARLRAQCRENGPKSCQDIVVEVAGPLAETGLITALAGRIVGRPWEEIDECFRAGERRILVNNLLDEVDEALFTEEHLLRRSSRAAQVNPTQLGSVGDQE